MCGSLSLIISFDLFTFIDWFIFAFTCTRIYGNFYSAFRCFPFFIVPSFSFAFCFCFCIVLSLYFVFLFPCTICLMRLLWLFCKILLYRVQGILTTQVLFTKYAKIRRRMMDVTRGMNLYRKFMIDLVYFGYPINTIQRCTLDMTPFSIVSHFWHLTKNTWQLLNIVVWLFPLL